MGINTGALYIIIIMLILLGLAYTATGPTPSQSPILTGTEVKINNAKKEQPQDKLTLLTFDGATITPPAGSVCNTTSKGIIIGNTPAHATAIPSDGFLKVWATDADQHLLVAPSATISHNSGNVLRPGDLNYLAPDGYRLAPQLYVFPQTVDAGGQPYYPKRMLGDYNNGRPQVARGRETLPYDSLPSKKYVLEYIWSIQEIGLTAGSYDLQYVIADGEGNHEIKCISIRVYDPVNPRYEIPD